MKENIKNKDEGKIRQLKQTVKKNFFFSYIKMLEITKKNCFKCNLETIIDNNSQYFWINLRYFEVETESK